MTTHFIFPKPQNWETFEDIVCDVFARKYQNLNLQRYGRSGQRQNGVDIAGLIRGGVLGVQCKHHVRGSLKTKEIDDEIAESKQFHPGLSEYVIATSADRDTKAHKHVLQISVARQAAGMYPVTLKFWDDICAWLAEYPDLIYKHFTKFFPRQELEQMPVTAFRQQLRTPIRWPCTLNELIHHVTPSLGLEKKVDPYLLSLGVTTFETATFAEPMDLLLDLSALLRSGSSTEDDFRQAVGELTNLRACVADSFFSRTVLLQVQARLPYAFLFGWMFRRVSGFRLQVVAGQEVWPSDGLILTPTQLQDDMPDMLNSSSNELVLVLNISRHIQQSVVEAVREWNQHPRAILSYRLDQPIRSAAQAMALADEIARKIKNTIDRWSIRRIHLFGALPAALAVLVGHSMNAICPIDLYYRDETRTSYQRGGTLLNSM